jgi:hypothetical protein
MRRGKNIVSTFEKDRHAMAMDAQANPSSSSSSSSVIKDGRLSGLLPESESFAVHYPGYPSSPSRAIQTLGGLSAIAKVLLPLLLTQQILSTTSSQLLIRNKTLFDCNSNLHLLSFQTYSITFYRQEAPTAG